MGYELVLRPRSLEKPLLLAELTARLDRAMKEGIGAALESKAALEASPAAQPEQAAVTTPALDIETRQQGPWSLPNGKARLAARLCLDGGEFRGLDFEIALGGSELEMREAIDFALRCAENWSGLVFDPQLGKELSRATVDEVVEKWREAQAYAANISGSYDDPRGVVEFQAPPPAISPRMRLGLLIGGGFLLIYWILGAVIEALSL